MSSNNLNTTNVSAKANAGRKVISISYDAYRYIKGVAYHNDIQLTEAVDLLVKTHKVVQSLHK